MKNLVTGSLKNPTNEELTRLSTLSVLFSSLSRAEGNAEIALAALKVLLKAVRGDRGFVSLQSGDHQATEAEYFWDCSGDTPSTEPFRFTSTWVKKCLETQKPVLVTDTEELSPTTSVSVSGIRSVMVTPIRIHNSVLGVVYIDSLVRAGCFEENDLKLFSLIGELVAVTLDRNLKAQTLQQQTRALNVAEAELEQAAAETIRRLSKAAEFRDGETSEHLDRVSGYCEAVSRELGLPEEEVAAIKVASLLHDVGKIGIPDSILLKPGRFTDFERKVMQEHTIFGARILADSGNPVIQMAASIALRHHEKWDGTGYPHGLSGEDIPLAARIVGIADVFDAVSSKRRYKDSYSLSDSFSLLEKESGSHFDPRVVKAFFAIRPLIEKIWIENQEEETESAEPEPAEPSIQAELPPEDVSTTGGIQIMVVDSDPYQREVISTEATRRGMRVAEVSDPREALNLIKLQAPDVVVLELADPGVEDVVAYLKNESPEIPILILTRDGDLSRRLSVSGLQNCAYLHKPLPPAAVVDEIEERLPSIDEEHSFTLLALDDDPVVLKILSRVLGKHGYRILVSTDPMDFWSLLVEHTPDLVLLDLEMPVASGFEICRVLRSDVKYRHLPVIVLTGHQQLSAYQSALEAGADDVLAKPLQPDRLLSRIESRLARNRAVELSAGRDSLTGLIHRREALRMGEQMFATTVRQGQPFSVCALEIEAFDQLVKEDGWQKSAAVLREVAEILLRTSRPEDVVSRCNDHTLLLLLPNTANDAARQRVASLNTRLKQQKGRLGTIACVGRTSSFPEDGNELKSLLAEVDVGNHRNS